MENNFTESCKGLETKTLKSIVDDQLYDIDTQRACALELLHRTWAKCLKARAAKKARVVIWKI
jgi:hypothetical protein